MVCQRDDLFSWAVTTEDRMISILFHLVRGLTKVTKKRAENEKANTIADMLMQGEIPEAFAAALRFVNEYPQSPEGWMLLGSAWLRKAEYDRAIDCFSRSLAINPASDTPPFLIGRAHRLKKDNAEAKRWYLRALQVNSGNPEVLRELSRVEIDLGNYPQAIEYGERAWHGCRSDPKIPAALAMAYFYEGQKAKSQEYVHQAGRLGYADVDLLQSFIDGKLPYFSI